MAGPGVRGNSQPRECPHYRRIRLRRRCRSRRAAGAVLYHPRAVKPGALGAGDGDLFALGSIGLLLAPQILSKRSALLLGLDGSIIAAGGIATSMAFALGSSGAFGWGDVTRAAPHTAVGLWVLGVGMLALAWHVETDPAATPRWLPISVAIVVVTSTVGLWQALVADGYEPFALLPAVVLGGGGLMAPILGLTVYMAQQAYAQAAALGQSEARKAAILDSALDCIVTIDHEGCITEFNPAAERTFGYRRDEVVGKQLADVIIPPSLREKHRRGISPLPGHGRGASAREAHRDDGDACRRKRIPRRTRDHAHPVGWAAVLHRLPARHHGTQTGRRRSCGAARHYLAEAQTSQSDRQLLAGVWRR